MFEKAVRLSDQWMQTRRPGEYFKPEFGRLPRRVGLKDASVVEQFAESLDSAHGAIRLIGKKRFDLLV
jgi:hypothetical protein